VAVESTIQSQFTPVSNGPTKHITHNEQCVNRLCSPTTSNQQCSCSAVLTADMHTRQ